MEHREMNRPGGVNRSESRFSVHRARPSRSKQAEREKTLGTIKPITGATICRWIEKNCLVPEGPLIGQPVRLLPFQREIICGIYDSPTRYAIITFPKKNGKTSLAACL